MPHDPRDVPAPAPLVAARLRHLAPGDDDPVDEHLCPYCGRPFSRRHWLAMHLGRRHGDLLDHDETTAWDAALAREEAYFARLRKHVRASLVVTPWVLAYFYGVLLIQQGSGNFALAVLPLPGLVGFLALIYYMVFTRDEAKAAQAQREGGGARRPERP